MRMGAVGLIAEYNPFHNGHLHHLREALRLSGAPVTVAVMSGHFLQRGEPALADKWVRTRMALAAGVDVVVELPFPWACNSAPFFAKGAVQVLDSLGGIDSLCFGSEAGDVEALKHCAELLDQEGALLNEETASALRRGVNFPAARSRAMGAHPPSRGAAAVLASPNNILGVAYLRALRSERSAIRPLTIPRIGAGYHESQPVEGIASATGIRRMLLDGEDPYPYLPDEVADILREAADRGSVADPERMLPLLLSKIFAGKGLRNIHLVGDGIENRLLRAADQAGSWQDLVSTIKSRHHTRTRVQRLLIYLLSNLTADEMAAHLQCGPLYLHLLGVGPRGRDFLAACRKSLRLPLVANYSRIHSLLKRRYGAGTSTHDLALRQLALELRATRNYTLLMRRWRGENRNRDFFEPLESENPKA